MKRLCFFDLSNDGHHWKYNINVIKSKISHDVECIYYTSNLDLDKKIELNKLNVKIELVKYKKNINQVIDNFIIMFELLLYCKKNKIDEQYILYLDPFVVQVGILNILYKKKIVGTLHWYSNRKLKEFILHKLKNRITIVVHTKGILNKLNNRAKLIYYPNFDQKLIEYRPQNKTRVPTILYFGALRLDKGIDILLDALNYTKENFNIIIAGKECDFTKEFIMNSIQKFDLSRFTIDINYISEEKMEQYYNISDIVILPYRKHFMGESGILVDSLTKGKVIISTPISSAYEIINEYRNGELFEFENIKMLSSKIDKVINNLEMYSINAKNARDRFNKIYSLDNFIKEYKNI